MADTSVMAPGHLSRPPVKRQPQIRAQRSRMTGDDLEAALMLFGVSSARFAVHCGTNERTVARWRFGRSPMPMTIHAVLWLYRFAPWTRHAREPLPGFHRPIP
jgi:hypothetical protein